MVNVLDQIEKTKQSILKCQAEIIRQQEKIVNLTAKLQILEYRKAKQGITNE